MLVNCAPWHHSPVSWSHACLCTMACLCGMRKIIRGLAISANLENKTAKTFKPHLENEEPGATAGRQTVCSPKFFHGSFKDAKENLQRVEACGAKQPPSLQRRVDGGSASGQSLGGRSGLEDSGCSCDVLLISWN